MDARPRLTLLDAIREQEGHHLVWQSARSKLKWAQLLASLAWPDAFDEQALKNRWRAMRRWVSRNRNQPAKEVNLNDMRVLIEQHYAPPNVARTPRALLPRTSCTPYVLRPHGAVAPSMVPSRLSALCVSSSVTKGRHVEYPCTIAAPRDGATLPQAAENNVPRVFNRAIDGLRPGLAARYERRARDFSI